jgi:hypothetical protein
MPVRYFAGFIGLLYTVLGLLGVTSSFVEPTQNIPYIVTEVGVPEGFGYLFGLFPTNVFGGSVYLFIGLMGILVAVGNEVISRLYAESMAVYLGIFALLGAIPVANTLFGLMPIYGNDVWLHAGSAIAAAYFGFIRDKGRRGRDPSPSQSPSETFRVAKESGFH